MSKNPFGKTNIESPYAVYEDARTGWRWEVLKTYKTRSNEENDCYARWFVKAYSPYVPSGEMGDTYRNDILQNATLVEATEEWREAYG
jgi:hypothetical protein|tara:strand:+ start:1082 stop:1345 length:264 start_codon:yes stop_codon:yes gene_type:complete